MKSDLEQALATHVAPWTDIEYRCKDFWIFKDGFPVTLGHRLFVPVNETMDCLIACYAAAYKWGYNGIATKQWDAFNVGQNVGLAAGQTVKYPHVHMIPRRLGDTEDPRGGVRHCVVGHGYY